MNVLTAYRGEKLLDVLVKYVSGGIFMDSYNASVSIWTDDIVNTRISDKRFKQLLVYELENADLFDLSVPFLSSIINTMKTGFPYNEKREAFGAMLFNDFLPYLKFMKIDRESFCIEMDEYDSNYSVVSFKCDFDYDRAYAKAEKNFKALEKKNSFSR